MVAPILVVDDDEGVRRALCEALEGAGMRAIAARGVDEALDAVAARSPSVVALGVDDPAREGIRLLSMLRARPATAGLPVLALVSQGRGGPDAEAELAQAFEAGADDCMSKPASPVELVARVRAQLRIRGYREAIAKREQDAEVVLELTHALASNLDFRDTLFTLVRRIAEVARVDRCSIVLVREHGDVGYVVAASDDETLRDLPIGLSKYPEIREVLSSGAPLVVRDAATHPLLEVARPSIPSGVTSLALLPIVFEGRPMGVLFLRASHTLAFDPYELSLYRTIANATAVALRNARILQSLRDQTKQSTFARFEAERQMKALQRYADFFQSAADGIVVSDVDGRLLFTNRRAQQITDRTESELIGMSFADLLAEEDRPRAREIVEGFRKGIFPEGLDVRARRADGSIVLLNVSFSSVMREERAFLFTFRDVTVERQTAEELKRTKEFLERVIDSSVDAIVAADMRGKVLLFNRAAERCYGYRAGEVVGKINVTNLYPTGVAKEIMRQIRAESHGGVGRLEDYRCDVLRKDGERVAVSLSAALIYDGGRPVASVGLFTDLRDRLRMEEKLKAAQSELQAREKQALIAELAGAAAHELNQPLTSVMGYGELLSRRLDRGTPAHAAAEIILAEAQRMAEIVRKVGKITKYETKSYLGETKILDLDKASEEPATAAIDSTRRP